MLFYFACEAAGASSARHSLRPLIFRCANLPAKLGRIAPRDRGGVAVRQLTRESAVVMAGLVPRLSGSIFVDKAHGVDSSVLQAFGDVLGHGEGSSHAASE